MAKDQNMQPWLISEKDAGAFEDTKLVTVVRTSFDDHMIRQPWTLEPFSLANQIKC